MIDFTNVNILQYILLGVAGGVINCIHANITKNDDITVLGTLETAIIGGFSAYVITGVLPHIYEPSEKYLSPLSAISGFLGRNLLSGILDLTRFSSYDKIRIGNIVVEKKKEDREKKNDKGLE